MKISACLMVKNESELLPQCLESIKWVDEIIVVDTGSTDNTIDIAKSYGAKVYIPPDLDEYFVETEYGKKINFGKARSKTIELATGDWVLIIDADEEIEEGFNPETFRQRLKLIHPTVSALVVTVHEVSDTRKTASWMSMRFFRKSSGIHYVKAAHNKAVFGGGCAGTDIAFKHYGYSLDPEKMMEKRERTKGLLYEQLKKDPGDFITMYYLMQIYVGEKDHKKAEEIGLRFFHTVTITPDQFQYLSVMYFYMAWTYLHLAEAESFLNPEYGEKAYAWAKKGLEYYPEDIDLHYILARIGYQSKRDDILKEHSDKYFELLPNARKRGKIESNDFVNQVNEGEWYNRTVFSSDIAAEMSIRQFLEAA